MDILENYSECIRDFINNKSITAKIFSRESGVNATTVNDCLHKKYLPNLKNTLNIADYMECSLEYLFGKTDKTLGFSLIPRVIPFYDNLINIMENQGITINQLEKSDLKITYSYFNRWKKGELPQLIVLNNLSNYLACTTDMLVGRERIELKKQKI